MGTCTNCVKMKEKKPYITLASRNTDLTIHSNRISELTKPETALQRKNHNKKISNDKNCRGSEDLDAPTATVLAKVKTLEEKTLILNALLRHFLFSTLPYENLQTLIEEMKLYQVRPHEIVFKQGEIGSNFFVLASGTLEIIVNGHLKGFIQEGNGFGELALIHDSERTATIKTVTDCQLWGIDRKAFRCALKSLSQFKYEENKNFIKSIPFANCLTEAQIEALVNVVVNESFIEGQKIIIEGDPGDLFYMIQEGSVQCSFQNKVIRTLNKGDYFGEQALLYNILRTATVTATNNVKVLCLGREMLISVLGNQLQWVLYKNSLRIAFDKCAVLHGFSNKESEAIIESIKVKNFKAGEIVIYKDQQKNEAIYFILKGALQSSSEKLEIFENFGSKWLYENDSGSISEDYVAVTDSDIGIISKFELEQILHSKFFEKIRRNAVVNVIRKVQLFSLLPEEKLESLAGLLKIKQFTANQVIFNQNEAGNSFYIVKKGEVNIMKDNNFIRTVSDGNFFGERSIILNESRTASAVSVGPSEIWVLTKEDFLSIVEASINKQLAKRMILQDDSVSLQDLLIVKVLGKGNFGNVFLCVAKNQKNLYALKTVARKKIKYNNLQESLALERKVMLQIEHPFIVKLVKTFKDPERVYFLQEYVQGQGLYEVLRVLNLLDSASTRFYAANLILILEHLHQKNIIYRDLKPENLMVDEDGYLKLLDFGTAKIIENRTYTVVGTPQYMAPEVILGKGYSFSADLWSLGILIYEFVCGRVPFGEDEEEPFSIYRSIISGNFVYPRFVRENNKEKVIIEQLLRNNPALRGNAEALKKHKWLAGMKWEDLISKRLRPPYLPEVAVLDEDIAKVIEAQNSVDEEIQKHEKFRQESIRSKSKYFNEDWDREF